ASAITGGTKATRHLRGVLQFLFGKRQFPPLLSSCGDGGGHGAFFSEAAARDCPLFLRSSSTVAGLTPLMWCALQKPLSVGGSSQSGARQTLPGRSTGAIEIPPGCEGSSPIEYSRFFGDSPASGVGEGGFAGFSGAGDLRLMMRAFAVSLTGSCRQSWHVVPSSKRLTTRAKAVASS